MWYRMAFLNPLDSFLIWSRLGMGLFLRVLNDKGFNSMAAMAALAAESGFLRSCGKYERMIKYHMYCTHTKGVVNKYSVVPFSSTDVRIQTRFFPLV